MIIVNSLRIFIVIKRVYVEENILRYNYVDFDKIIGMNSIVIIKCIIFFFEMHTFY